MKLLGLLKKKFMSEGLSERNPEGNTKRKLSGKNDKYPFEIEIWKIGDPVPEWLSDRARVKFIDGNGNITLDRRDRPDGGYEIVGSSGIGNLVTVKERSGVVCFGGGRVFSLTERQFQILYET